jgi:hypothetical protein
MWLDNEDKDKHTAFLLSLTSLICLILTIALLLVYTFTKIKIFYRISDITALPVLILAILGVSKKRTKFTVIVLILIIGLALFSTGYLIYKILTLPEIPSGYFA